jgi:ATP-dependent RNA helicase RhlE
MSSYSFRSTRSSSAAGRYSRSKTGQRNHKSGARRRGQYIDPSRFVQAATGATSEKHQPVHAFADFALHKLLQKNLAVRGYVQPSPIQDQAIPAGLEGRDVIGIASTGTGKTAAFALPILHKLIDNKGAAAIIIAPTRELAQQIEQECRHIARGSGIFATVLIGGTNMGAQLRDLRNKPQVIIGTPGRIKDHLRRGSLQLNTFSMVVLDEVDRMLDMGFVDDVTEILKSTHATRQSFFFSATIDARVRRLIDTFTDNPVVVQLKASSASENVHQDVVRYRGNIEKIDKLHDILIKDEVAKVIVFDETQRSVERLHGELIARGFAADAIHGGKTQGQRQRALKKFKQNESNVLVATDVAARGIDVADVSHVVNYSIPQAYDDYIHRIGRAGRAGKIGYALTFVSH